MTDIPDGWTDDMTFPLPEGVTVEKIVDYVLASAAGGEPHESRVRELRSWGLAADDAELACDRALGGAFRAGTTSPENEPSAEKDPIAHVSYHHCRANPRLISTLFPKQAQSGPRRLLRACVLFAALLTIAEGCWSAHVWLESKPYKLMDQETLMRLLAVASIGGAVLGVVLCQRLLRRRPWIIPVAATCLAPALILAIANGTFVVGLVASGGGWEGDFGWKAAVSESLPSVFFGFLWTLPVAVVGSAAAMILERRFGPPG